MLHSLRDRRVFSTGWAQVSVGEASADNQRDQSKSQPKA
jgi:hypothetical protein